VKAKPFEWPSEKKQLLCHSCLWSLYVWELVRIQ